MELRLAAPSPDHLEFDQMCSELDDFEHLPALTAVPPQAEPETGEESSLDGQILAGLVSPH